MQENDCVLRKYTLNYLGEYGDHDSNLFSRWPMKKYTLILKYLIERMMNQMKQNMNKR